MISQMRVSQISGSNWFLFSLLNLILCIHNVVCKCRIPCYRNSSVLASCHKMFNYEITNVMWWDKEIFHGLKYGYLNDGLRHICLPIKIWEKFCLQDNYVIDSQLLFRYMLVSRLSSSHTFVYYCNIIYFFRVVQW